MSGDLLGERVAWGATATTAESSGDLLGERAAWGATATAAAPKRNHNNARPRTSRSLPPPPPAPLATAAAAAGPLLGLLGTERPRGGRDPRAETVLRVFREARVVEDTQVLCL